jgi:hypothetical protein
MSYTIAFPENGKGTATLISALGEQSEVSVSTTHVGNVRMMTVTACERSDRTDKSRGPRGEMVLVPADILLGLQSVNITRIAAMSDISDSLLYNLRSGNVKEIGSIRLERLRAALAGGVPEHMNNGAASALGGVC